MRVLVFGGSGMLGRVVVEEARRRGLAALGLSRRQADITREGIPREWVERFRPQLVVNCAAFTRVDDCEAERKLAREVNGHAVANVADAAESCGALLTQISTDYVFDGRSSTPYENDAATAPMSVYGESKLLGEQAARAYPRSLVLRVSWLFGPGGGNFVTTMLRLADQGMNPLRVVDDQVGGPTYTRFLARALLDLASKGATGVLSYQNREAVSWYGFAREILRQARPSVAVEPAATADFPRPARRPAYSVLDVGPTESLLQRPVETWSSGLALYLAEIGELG
ncbi:MAG: dTDP-4-dehydrorhamnose reductase [Acidobacteria bacterium]|nr:dTDP-4-dehydrorhamnose reductase [Acidobacteriota bacterium]